jgi:hypothetical protein
VGTEVSFVAGDTGSKLRVTIRKKSDGSVWDLTGQTVTLKWLDANGTLVTKTMSSSDPTTGIAEYQFTTGELFTGEMRFEVRVVGPGGTVHGLAILREIVRAPIEA